MSVPTYGAQECRVYWVQESTYGITPTNPSMLGVNTTQQVEPVVDPGLIKVYGIGSRDYQAFYPGMQKVKLKIPTALNSQAPISFIQHIQTLYSLSLEVIYYKGSWTSPSSILSYVLAGCKLDKLSVECHIEDVIKATVDLIGQSFTRSTSLISGATYADYTGAIPFNNSYVQQGAPGGGSYTTLLNVTDWKFEVENRMKEVPIIASGGTGLMLKYLRERNRIISGELTLEFDSDQAVQDLLANTEFSLLFRLGSNTALCKYCKWDEFTTPTKIEDLVSAKAKFTARDFLLS
jgi:hypothetical protein